MYRQAVNAGREWLHEHQTTMTSSDLLIALEREGNISRHIKKMGFTHALRLHEGIVAVRLPRVKPMAYRCGCPNCRRAV